MECGSNKTHFDILVDHLMINIKTNLILTISDNFSCLFAIIIGLFGFEFVSVNKVMNNCIILFSCISSES